MPPKKTKVKALPEKIYNFLTTDEVAAREQRYTNHMMELRACLNFMEDAILLVSQMDKDQMVANKWLDYITCITLPKPYTPYDIRLYMEKLKFFERNGSVKTIDWTLSVNEHSLLSQNIFRKDLTMKFLKDTLKRDFGYEYEDDINNCLNVLRRIEYFLDNDVEVAKCSRSVLEEIKHLKTVLQDEISLFFNRYTYRILCSEKAYMTSVDAITAEYCFSANNFEIHIWSLKNVPIRFGLFAQPRLVANLHELKITLQIPLSMLQQNLSVRAIHRNFDHVSEYAKSFSPEIAVPLENINAGIQELPECLLNEWLMQMDIQNRIRNSMVEKRLDYEKQMRLFEGEEENKKKGKKANQDDKKKKAKAQKVVKPLKEPPAIDPDVYPDIWPDFLAEEQNQYLRFIDTVYNPQCIGLEDDEINMKKFFILGGTYELSYVRKPLHYDFNSFNMTWHQDDRRLEIDKNVCIRKTIRASTQRTTRLIQRSRSRFTNAMIEAPVVVKDSDCPWFIITIILPDYLCYWGEPIACHYETISKIIETPILEPAPSVVSVKKKHKSGHAPAQPVPEQEPEVVKEQVPNEQEYFNFLESQKGRLSTALLRAITYSKLSLDDIIFRASLPSIRSSLLQKADSECNARDAEGVLNIQDFKLNEILSKPQIRHMERHIIPRIISSFKFPKELREDELEAIRSRPKTKGGTLIRKQVTSDHQIVKSNHIFSFSQRQNNPERLFTVFPEEEKIRVIKHVNNPVAEAAEPQSFAQLVSIINFIKRSYKHRLQKLSESKVFKIKVKLVNKRVKEQLKISLKKQLRKSIEKSRSMLLARSKSTLKQRSTMNAARIAGSRTTVSDDTEISLKESSDSETKVAFIDSKIEDEKKGKKVTNRITYSCWTTKHVLKSEFDRAKCTIVLQTDKLGCFGFAFKRYEHFPFKYWKLEPSDTDPENEVIFTLETQYVACVLYISGNGIRGHVTEPTKAFKRNPKKYMIIDNPIKDFTEFKKRFKENYLNIFADNDATFYIENGYFSEKHLATEMHTYSCMAVHSSQIKFEFSQWNRLSSRRDLILQFVQNKDLPDNIVQVRLTPEGASFVEITELCSDNVDDIKLKYDLTWRNLSYYSDLHYVINSMYPSATDLRCKNPQLLTCIRNLLAEIRPLSFS